MLTNAMLQCVVCNSTTMAPRMHSNLLQRDGVQTYCATCNAVRQHTIVGGVAPPGIQTGTPFAGNLPRPSPQAVPALSRPTAGVPAQSGYLDDDQLWKALEARLGGAHVALDEVVRADDSTRGRVFASLGFDAVQESRLNRIMAARFPDRDVLAARAAGQPNSPPARAPSFDPTASGLPAGTPILPVSSIPTTNVAAALMSAASTIPGLQLNGDQLIARCSVFPNLPAEYWCCSCNVLVSSRCHVQGIHKDHPFITLRLAAEAHIRDLAAWNERCRAQLNVATSVVNNLRHADQLSQSSLQHQINALDEHVESMIEDIKKWRDQLKVDMSMQVIAQTSSIQLAIKQTEALFSTYSQCLAQAEPLMTTIPPLEAGEKSAEDWALRVLDLVSRLKQVHMETIPMPKCTVPQVTCSATPATNMDLLKCVAVPLSVRLPDVMDPGYFNFPHPSVSARVPFTITATDEASAKGVVIYNGRTLTRAQDTAPSHHLVVSSQVFYNGTVSWEVHIDRLGSGPSRILLGVVVSGTDGEGVVWDGPRIVGPNEGECRNVDERYVWRQGTVLRFHLELEAPQCYLNCFYDRDGVARIPLPSTGLGWTPAFSVLGPQDQITVVPQVAGQGSLMPKMDRRPLQRAAGDTVAQIERQDHIISSIQQQIQSLQSKLDQEVLRAGGNTMQSSALGSPYDGAAMGGQRQASQQQPTNPMTSTLGVAVPAATVNAAFNSAGVAAPAANYYNSNATAATPRFSQPVGVAGVAPAAQPAAVPAMGSGGGRIPLEAYSPELRQLMRYVEDIGT